MGLLSTHFYTKSRSDFLLLKQNKTRRSWAQGSLKKIASGLKVTKKKSTLAEGR